MKLLFSNSPTKELSAWLKDGTENKLDGKFGLSLISQKFFVPGSEASDEYVFCRKAPGVTVVPILPNGNLIITRTFKHGANCLVWEFPAGRKPKNVSSAEQAKIELSEESGLTSNLMISLGRALVAPRKFDTYEDLFVACNCAVGTPKPEAKEFQEVYELDPVEFWEKVFSSEEIVSGFSQMAAFRASVMRYIPMISDDMLADYQMHAGNYRI